MFKLEWPEILTESGESAPIAFYNVYMRDSGDGECLQLNAEPIFCTQFVLRDRLSVGSSYAFKVEAIDDAGATSNCDAWCSPIFVEQPIGLQFDVSLDTKIFAAFTEPPSLVLPMPSVQSISASCAHVYTQPLTEANVVYTCFYKPHEQSEWRTLSADSANFEIVELRHDVAYVFRMQAETTDGLIFTSAITEPIKIDGRRVFFFHITATQFESFFVVVLFAVAMRPPTIIKPLHDLSVVEDQFLQLECTAHSPNEPVQVTWLKDDVQIDAKFAQTSVNKFSCLNFVQLATRFFRRQATPQRARLQSQT